MSEIVEKYTKRNHQCVQLVLLLVVDTRPEYVAPTVQRMLRQFFALHKPSDIKITYETEDITAV